MGRIITELERIYGVRQGSAYTKPESTMSTQVTQEDIYQKLGISKDTYLNYKKLTTLIPELQEMVDNGNLTTCLWNYALTHKSTHLYLRVRQI